MPDAEPRAAAIGVPRPDLVSFLAENPDGILEQVAKKFDASTFDVVFALPSDHAITLTGSSFGTVMEDVATWGEVLMIVHTPNIVLECKGTLPSGTYGRGYYNIHGDSPIGGHIRAERCAHITFVSRPFMGRKSCSIQFFDEDGEAMFKIFARRDEERNLVSDQVRRFNLLRDRLMHQIQSGHGEQ